MKYMHTIFTWIIPILLLTPLFFLPLTQDYYDTNKWFLLMCITIGVLFLVAATTVKTKRISLTFSASTIGLGAITVASIVSLFVVSHNRIEALLTPFGPSTFAALTLLSLLVPSFLHEKTSHFMRWLLYITTSLVALIAVYQFFGMGKVMFPGALYLADPLWSPTGATVATVSLLVIVLPLLLADVFEAFRRKHESHIAFLIIMTIAVITGLGITLWQLTSRISGTLLPLVDGWAILLEILKNPKHALFGVGAENFLTAFSAGRPAAYNTSLLWSTRFTTNANLLFHLATIYGLLGTAACLLFLKSFTGKKHNGTLNISLLLGLITLLITPPNLTILVVLTVLFILSDQHQKHAVTYTIPHNIVARVALSISALTIAALACFGAVGSYASELIFYQSLRMAQANNGTGAYNLQTKAIGMNPRISRYHTIYSQTNLVLAMSVANALTQSGPARSDDETTKDRNLIAQLIQQAIAEAKLAVKLNPINILAWENLARTYRELLDVAQGADVWAVTSYKQAILLDPVNPVLRLELGSVYVKQKNYTDAITQFQKAISLKANYTNAYYLLGLAYYDSGDTNTAVQTMTTALSFVERNSADYQTIADTLESFQKKAPANTQAQNTDTTSATVVPPLDLPNDSGPTVSQ